MLNPDKNKRDLFVLGSGELGARVATLWRSQFPDAKVICETLTPRTHSSLEAIGCLPRLRSDALALTFPYVIAAIPPSKTLSYASEMRRAGAIWDGSGCLLGISSTGVYREDEGGWVNEASPLADSDRARVLIAGEEQISSRGGAILRLAGLYSTKMGATRRLSANRNIVPKWSWLD